ncbi:MAG: hypothetical protein BJ554DRAFT_4517 [Olpidium bornovanus]|uniref:Uncharacterized protein n=1 Tax=Olpidium bornovanus TaxID=278681 RepID=A0A8H8DF63_9FUNG|nr:MAG: hypothetical protein BJ554DRAFT_4517 [Olpidium bornovanus]
MVKTLPLLREMTSAATERTRRLRCSPKPEPKPESLEPRLRTKENRIDSPGSKRAYRRRSRPLRTARTGCGRAPRSATRSSQGAGRSDTTRQQRRSLRPMSRTKTNNKWQYLRRLRVATRGVQRRAASRSWCRGDREGSREGRRRRPPARRRRRRKNAKRMPCL